MINRNRVASAMLLLCGASLPALAARTQVTITGGEQQASSGVFDTGTFALQIGGHTETISYGRFSTNSSVASGLAAKFSQDCNSPVIAHANGAVVTFETRDPAAPIGILSAVSVWDQGDFQLASFALNVPASQPPSMTPTFKCSPGTIISGENMTCAVTLVAGAVSPVYLSIGGNIWATAVPDASGIAVVNSILTEPTQGTYTVSYAYPGDPSASIPAASGSTNVLVDAPGSQIGSGGTLYQYQIEQANNTSGYDPTGNIVGYSDSVNGAWALGYDNLNRLISSVQAPMIGGASYGCWQYDSFGNILSRSVSDQPVNGTTCQGQSAANTLQSTFQFMDSTNRISSAQWYDDSKNTHTGNFSYDGAGNVTNDLSNTYLYNAEGHICAISAGGSIWGYLYDAEGNRVAKGTLQSMTCDPSQLQITATYFIGPDGGTMTEMDGQGNWVRTEVSAAGMNLATYTPIGVHYPISDWLGTKRVTVNPNQTINAGVEETCTSLPVGNGLNCIPFLDPSPKHFTGEERDAESGLDYFPARYLSSNVGRWESPDPYDGSMDFTNPQSLNRYNYVGNNPLRFTDPLGLQGGEFDSPPNDDCEICNIFDDIGNFFTGHGGHTLHASTNPRPDAGHGEPFTGDANNGCPPYCGFTFTVTSSYHAPSSLLGKLCGAVPSGTVVSVSGNGNFVGTAGSLDLVTNGRTGEVTGFFSPGYFAGYTSAGASLTGGYTFGNLGSGNSNFSGGFTGVSGGWGFFTGSVATSSGGPANPLSITGGVTTVSAGLQTPSRGILASTTYSLPTQLGKFWTLAADPATVAVFAANQLCALAGH